MLPETAKCSFGLACYDAVKSKHLLEALQYCSFALLLYIWYYVVEIRDQTFMSTYRTHFLLNSYYTINQKI